MMTNREKALAYFRNREAQTSMPGARAMCQEAIKALEQPEIIRCKECRHRIVNDHYGERGYLDLKAYCELDSGDPFELSREAENDDWFCADAERGEAQHGFD